MRKQLHILLFLLMSCIAWGQTDTIPFLKASLMVGEPSTIYPQTVFGHAFLRLQCPSAKMDNCFSMESGNYEGFKDICTGNYPNRLVAIITKDYLQSFDKEGRIVTEYPLNLTQKEIQRLWQFLDEKVASGNSPFHDFFHHGCSQEIIRFLAANLEGKIIYGERAKTYGNTLYKLGVQTLPKYSWIRIPFTMLLTTDGTDTPLEDDEKTAVPYIIPDLFSDANIVAKDGTSRPILLNSETPIVHQPSQHLTSNFTIPIHAWFALLLAIVFVLSLLSLKFQRIGKFMDVFLFLTYLTIVIVLIYINTISTLSSTSGWNWNFIIYNPIPLIIWLYGKWQNLSSQRIYLCYAFVIVLFLVAISIVGGHYVLGQFYMALTFAVRCLFKYIEKRY